MSVLRSEAMVHKKIRIPKQSAVEILNHLGMIENAIEFIDLNKENFEAKKNYQSLINRTEELDQKINYFEKLAESYGYKFQKYKEYSSFQRDLEVEMKQRGMKADEFLDHVENEIFEDEKVIIEQRLVFDKTKESYENLRDKFAVFKKARQLSANVNFDVIDNLKQESGPIYGETNEDGIDTSSSNLRSISGIIKQDDAIRLKKMVFRISRGRAIPTFFDLDEDDEEELKKLKAEPKKIFNIFFQGGVENILKMKLLKICDVFNCSRFHIPGPEKVNAELDLLNNEIQIKKQLITESESSIRTYIQSKSGNAKVSSKFELYRNFLRQKKMIYTNLNKCTVRDNFIDGEVWIPENKFPLIQAKMLELLETNTVESTANFFDVKDGPEVKPPTFIRTNEFFWAFQEIVNTYGVPRYREINPTFFNIVTFPFLFGIMFGDIGHGFALFCFGIYLCLNNESLKNDPGSKLFSKARYLLLGMGFFSFFSGLIYNDFLSIPLQVFNSCYEVVDHENGTTRKIPECDYYFGLDHRWYVAHNELTFVNSLKMKTSVILGVSQMIFGIVLKCFNAIHFGSTLDLFLEGVPQLFFMCFLFGYMDVLIFLKWSTDWTEPIKAGKGAPSIITQMMNFIIGLGGVDMPIWGGENSQQYFHYVVLIVIVIAVPLMLIPKPIILYLRNKQKQANSRDQYNRFNEEDGRVNRGGSQDSLIDKGDEEHGHDHESFGELFIHQAIETIEFVLGGVSNTASYLRLWALSLAHGQLSKVIYDKTLGGFISDGNFGFIFLGYFFFINATFGILLCMDLMECFLHTLRLHWVEFQNKFYKADGYLFVPFNFKALIERDDD